MHAWTHGYKGKCLGILRYLKDIGKQIFWQDCPQLGVPILVCWAGYVGFKLGGYEQPGSKENNGSVKDSSWRKIGFVTAPVFMIRFVWGIACRGKVTKWDNKGTDESGLS